MTEKMRRRIALALSAVLACLPAIVQAQTAELQKGLAQLFATAELHNATLRSLETALQTAEAGVITAQAAKLPDITGEAAVSYLGNARLWNRQFGESTAAPMPHFGNNFSLAARQVVYGGGGINAGIQLARQGGKLAQLNAEDGKQRVRFLHFFQALSIFNILHMFVGGLAGAALHAWGLNYYVADGFARYSGYLDEVRRSQTPVDFARYMEQMVENLLAQSVKILFGWTLYAALFFALLMLLWDIPGVRRRVKHMQTWPRVGLQVLNGVRRQQKLLRLRRKRSKME